MFAKY